MTTALQEILDREAIRAVISRFCRGSDRQERELVQSCYHPDAIDDHGIYHGPGLELFDATAASRAQVRVLHHHLGQSTIELDGDRATAETYCIATTLMEGDDATPSLLMVRYLDRFERRDGAWKIAHRYVAFDAAASVAGGLPTFLPERNWGRRDHEDVSHALFAADDEREGP